MGYIADNLTGVKYFENCLGWNRNGSTGYVFIHNHKFSTTDDHRPMILKNKYIGLVNFEYARFYIEKVLLQKFSWNDKAGKDKVAKLSFSLPVNSNNELDIKQQNKIAKKIKLIDELQAKVKEYQQYIENVKIDIKDNHQYKTISILELFGKDGIKKGLSNYTNAYIQKHKGTYPLYSSQTTNDGIIGYIDSFDYDEKCITWTTDGKYAGTVFLRDEEFSMTTHCGALILNSNLESIYLEYVLNYLQDGLKSYAVGGSNKRVAVDIIKKVIIKIPVDNSGSFDINKQKEISEKYQRIENIKQAIGDELCKIQNSTIEL